MMFPSKILLFGEYSVLLNSDALAIPYNRFKGELVFADIENTDGSTEHLLSNQRLSEFLSFLNKTNINTRLSFPIDLDSIERDIKKGMYFKSDIPEGFGLGSSGAVVAAVYSKYKYVTGAGNDIPILKNDLALLESYFHGSSSGIDPLVCYLNSALLMRSGMITQLPAQKIERSLRDHGLFLLRCQESGDTAELVRKFKTKCVKDPWYLRSLKNNYLPANNSCIALFTDNVKDDAFFAEIRGLAILQSTLFKEMIPEKLVPLVKYGLENDFFYLKLCGSGGGGYFLGFTDNMQLTESYFKDRGHQIFAF